MINRDLRDALRSQLFAEGYSSVHAILDGASVPGLLRMLAEHQVEYTCLYRGELEPDLAEVAPYLIKLAPGNGLTNAVLDTWGQHWGIFVHTQADMRELRRHFRKFLLVYSPDNQPLYFRYYDPRVLRVYLPTCNSDEASTVFGPVKRYLMEDESSASLISFRLDQGVVQVDRSVLTGDSTA